MSDVKLFRVSNGSAEELAGRLVKLEKKLRALIERHIEKFLHVRFVASEYSTGKTHAGRIDTLGLDENSATIQLQTLKNSLLMWLPLDPGGVTLKDGFSRDMRGVGRHGTGDLELTIRNLNDLEKAKPLIHTSFEEN